MAMTDSKLLSDHFTPWSASPYHLLHPLQPYLHKEKQYFETFWGGLELGTWSSNNLGHIEKSKQNLEKQKNSSKTKKTNQRLLGECRKPNQKCFWQVSMQKTKPKMLKKTKNFFVFCFLRSWYIISIQKKCSFLVFHFRHKKNLEKN